MLLLTTLVTLAALAASIVFGIPSELWGRAIPASLVLSLPALVGGLAVWRYHRSFASNDKPPWGELSQCAGEWAQQTAVEEGLNVRVVVERYNGFSPRENQVGLLGATFTETTIRARAIAAHELGHVWLHRRAPVFAWLTLNARSVYAKFLELAVLLAIANLVVANPLVPALATGLAIAAAVSGALVLADEALATFRGRRLLTHPEVSSSMRRGANRVLFWALMSYAGTCVGMLLAIFALPWMFSAMGPPLPPLPELGVLGEIAIASIPLLLFAKIVLIAVSRLLDEPSSGVRLLRMWVQLCLILLAPLVVFACAPLALQQGHEWLLLMALVPAASWTVLPIAGGTSILLRLLHSRQNKSLGRSTWRLNLVDAVAKTRVHRENVDDKAPRRWLFLLGSVLNTTWWYIPLLVALAMSS